VILKATREPMGRSTIWAWMVWLVYLAILGLMFATLVAASLDPGDAAGRYLSLFTAPSFREAFLRTHAVAAISTAMVAVAGVLFLFSWRLRSGAGLAVLLRAPILLNGFPAALAYLIVFGNAGWINRSLQVALGLSEPPLPLSFTFQALLLFFAVFGLPYFLAYTVHAIDGNVAELEDASRLLGCGPGGAFRRVTMPLLRSSLKSALCLVYMLAAGSLAVPMVIGGSRNALLTAEIYGLVAAFADLSGAAALSLGLIVSLLVPLLVIDRGVDWVVDLLARARPAVIPGSCPSVPVAGLTARKASRWLIRGARGYQLVWLVLLCGLVATPLYSSFVLDWGAGVLPRSWTLQWYATINPQFWGSLRLSLILSVGCVVLSLVFGLPLAVAWRFGPLPAKRLLKALVLLPIGVPGFLWGLSLLVVSYRWYPPFAQSPFILLAGQAFLSLPFMLRVLMSALEEYDASYLEVAGSLGAGSLQRFSRVLVPMLLPTVGVGSALVFVRSFGESNLSLMVAPTGYATAPLWLYQAIGNSGIGVSSVLELFLVAVPLAALLGWEAWLRRRAPWATTRVALQVG
jgi:ABC-type Fe3+ transport system permease subunit